MNDMHRLALINRALNKCTPVFREAVETYFAEKSYKHMLRFFCLLDEFCKHGKCSFDYVSYPDDVRDVLRANHMHGELLFMVLDNYVDNVPKYDRAWQCWSVLDDLSYILNPN